MTKAQAKERLKRLRAMVKDQPEKELRTQFASIVDEIAVLEKSFANEPEERQEKKGSDRKKRTGHDRSE